MLSAVVYSAILLLFTVICCEFIHWDAWLTYAIESIVVVEVLSTVIGVLLGSEYSNGFVSMVATLFSLVIGAAIDSGILATINYFEQLF